MNAGGVLGEQPSRMQPADLASAFGTARSEGLAGRLPPRPVPPPAPEPASEPEGQPARRKKPATPRSGPRAPAGSGSRTIVVYVNASVRGRLRVHGGERSYTEVVLEALDATHARLQAKFNTPAAPPNSLFAGRGRPRRRRHEEPQVQISLRPLRDDVTVIDRLQAQVGAPSRSALINAALDEHLPRTTLT